MHPAALFAALSRQVPPGATMPVDVGNDTYSFGRYFESAGQPVLMSGYLGSIGFALPAALGAWAATREPGTRWHGRKVVSVSGDGGLGQYLAEVTTLARYEMDVTHVLLHDGELGKISREQRAGEWEVWETRLRNPDFAKFAENCGVASYRVTTADQLDEALAAAITREGPALVEVMADASLI